MAVSDQILPRGIIARALREGDLDAALALSEEAGWNQNAADWRIFLELGRVIGLTRGDGGLIATAAMLPYGSFAWISMVLVTASERRQGLARWLLRHCIDEVLSRKLVPVLDATPAGQAVYSGLGFHACWTMRRLVATTVRQSSRSVPPAAATIRPVEERDWPGIVAYDKAVFGADRSILLRRLAHRLPAAALVAERHGRVAGYLLGRDGRKMSQLGPLAAENEGIATALLAHTVVRVPPPFVIDLPDRHASLGEWLNTLNFRIERPFTRMVYGRSNAFDDSARLFAIAGPELG
jgi:GNAT superfamily N-acetyltransferase